MFRPVFPLILLASFIFSSFAQVDESRLQAVEASVQIQEAPPQMTLVWPNPERPAARYRISRRDQSNGSWSEVAIVDGSSTSWSDGNVNSGARYEYRIIKETTQGYLGHSYLKAGIRAPILEDSGVVLILTRDYLAGGLLNEIRQLENDLFLEGWTVLKQTVADGQSPSDVRNFIRSVYNNSNGKLKAVILIGHVPVPYSGDIMPDGHANHRGAWPADGFYGDMTGEWTDSSVNTRTAEREVNWNVPGDGKFDQNFYPANVDVAVGRIDFFEMTCYANKPQARSELDLTRQYLNKNHAFRSGQWQVQPRGVILDNFGLRDTNGVAATGWMNFAAFFGASANSKMGLDTYFPRLKNESALWSWTAGGGSYYYSSGVGTSDDFALTDVNVVFSLSLGSYFGDWNNESNWLKAALGSGKILVSLYSGIPRNFFHSMALGGTIGDSFLIGQNNNSRDAYLPDTQGTHEVHQALLGDPTLRMWPRAGVNSFSAEGKTGSATLTWSPPASRGYAGVHVYRGVGDNGPPMTRITNDPIPGNTFNDVTGPGTYTYVVRPVYLESNGSGSFFNLGQGTMSGGVIVTQGQTTTNQPRVSARRSGPNTFTITVTGDPGRSVVVESSENYTTWGQAATGTTTSSGVEFTLPLEGVPRKVFRARY